MEREVIVQPQDVSFDATIIGWKFVFCVTQKTRQDNDDSGFWTSNSMNCWQSDDLYWKTKIKVLNLMGTLVLCILDAIQRLSNWYRKMLANSWCIHSD